MTRLTDGKKIAEISMTIWKDQDHTPDFSNEFFEIGGLKYDEEKEAYIVPDVEYCIHQAEDWETFRGDYFQDRYGYDITKEGERCVFAYYLN